MTQQKQGIDPFDVLIQEGHTAENHPGNHNFRRKIHLNVEIFAAAKAMERYFIVQSIIGSIHQEGGRFLTAADKTESPATCLKEISSESAEFLVHSLLGKAMNTTCSPPTERKTALKRIRPSILRSARLRDSKRSRTFSNGRKSTPFAKSKVLHYQIGFVPDKRVKFDETSLARLHRAKKSPLLAVNPWPESIPSRKENLHCENRRVGMRIHVAKAPR